MSLTSPSTNEIAELSEEAANSPNLAARQSAANKLVTIILQKDMAVRVLTTEVATLRTMLNLGSLTMPPEPGDRLRLVKMLNDGGFIDSTAADRLMETES